MSEGLPAITPGLRGPSRQQPLKEYKECIAGLLRSAAAHHLGAGTSRRAIHAQLGFFHCVLCFWVCASCFQSVARCYYPSICTVTATASCLPFAVQSFAAHYLASSCTCKHSTGISVPDAAVRWLPAHSCLPWQASATAPEHGVCSWWACNIPCVIHKCATVSLDLLV
jgi:hypothetical protein